MQNERVKELLGIRPENYVEAKTQAVQIDHLLGFRCDEIEAKLQQLRKPEDNKFWIGLDSQAFQTPYSEILEMIEQIQPRPNQTWIDLGAGYGRVGIVLSIFAPNVKFIGYEYVIERFNEAQRIYSALGLPISNMQRTDLVDKSTQIPEADVYFIYDFSDRESVVTVLNKLQIIATQKPIKVIARGRGAKNWIFAECPWLCEVNNPKQFSTWILFQS